MAAASEQTVLQFAPTASSNTLSAKVHPLVIFNICDCYVRRPDQSERVIGTLLGSVLPDGTVDIRNSFAVPHNESSDQVALDIAYHNTMLASHQKVNPKEVIVGWYSTGLGVTGGSALIHDFYSDEVSNPVHLTVDTGFRNGEPAIKAYVSVNLSLGSTQLAAQFQEIPLDLRMIEAERIGCMYLPSSLIATSFIFHASLFCQGNKMFAVDILKTTMVDKLPTDLEGMEASMQRLLALIDDIYKYVDDVVQGNTAPDNSVGRLLSEIVASLPKLSPAVLDKLVNDNMQDHLLLLYLSSITRTQLSLAEKLNTAAQII
ncbi:Eukaryotic translation initiation factor 3 subunit F [Linum perenne]